MKKVGILTFHDGINHGAYLQAYSLMKTVEKLGFNVEIINYKNRHHWKSEYRAFLIRKNVIMILLNLYKILKFRKAQQKFKLNPQNLLLDSQCLYSTPYDVIIVGSDIVWNFELDHLGKDPVYFGHKLNAQRIISFAPSFGAININTEAPDYVVEGLKKFSAISVRDENSRVLTKKIFNRDPKVVLDPTFLYDFRDVEIEPKFEKFLLVYAFRLRKTEIEQLKKFAALKKLKTIAIGYENYWCDKNVIALDPFEWLGYFKKAAYVATGTFHGTIFCIKYNKNFCISNNDAINNKILAILGNLKLLNRILAEDNTANMIFNDTINYAEVNSKLEHLVNDSVRYLKEALDA